MTLKPKLFLTLTAAVVVASAGVLWREWEDAAWPLDYPSKEEIEQSAGDGVRVGGYRFLLGADNEIEESDWATLIAERYFEQYVLIVRPVTPMARLRTRVELFFAEDPD